MTDYLTDYNPGNSNVKVELDFKNYATKEELKIKIDFFITYCTSCF